MLLPIHKSNENQYVGLRAMWVLACASVKNLLFDNNGKIIAVEKTEDWKEIEFELHTAFLLQEKKRIGSGTINLQKIYFEQNGISSENLNALSILNDNGCLNIVAKDNSGNFHFCGISRGNNPGLWHQQDMRTGDGHANTNTVDSNIPLSIAESIQCLTYNYAPFCDNPLTMPSSINIIYYAQGFSFVTTSGAVFNLNQ